jgi:hypothetical protein
MDHNPLALEFDYSRRTPLRRLLVDSRLQGEKEGWGREPVGIYELETLRNDRAWLAQYSQVYLGMESVTVRDERMRYVHEATWPCTSGELAREYLKHTLGGRRRVAPRPDWYRRTAPLWCTPHRGTMAYVDLRHAYWEIVRRFCPEVAFYKPGTRDQEIIHPRSEVAWTNDEQVDEDRRLRHAIVGALFSRSVRYHHYGEPVEQVLYAGHHRPSLYRICMDMLHAVALDVSRHFALHAWLTDAAIVDERDAEGLREFLMERWSFPSEVKGRGRGSVVNTSSYRLGELHDPGAKWTEDQRNGTTARRQELHRIAKVNVTWWREQRRRSVGIS